MKQVWLRKLTTNFEIYYISPQINLRYITESHKQSLQLDF